jgi:hypothetical protein
MVKVNPQLLMLGAGAIALLVVGVYIAKKGVAGAAAAATGAAVDAASGVVLGIGDAIGVPRTDESECDKAIREGRTWDASFACPAGKWIGSVFTSSPTYGQANSGGATGAW